jgi:hypothetical protein
MMIVFGQPVFIESLGRNSAPGQLKSDENHRMDFSLPS